MNCWMFFVGSLMMVVSLVSGQFPYRTYYPAYYRYSPNYSDYYYNYYRAYYNQNNRVVGDSGFHLGHNVRRSSHLDRYGGNNH